MISTIRIEQNVPMVMRDGVILRADVYRPDDKDKHPAILMRTPYNKVNMEDMASPKFDFIMAGYAIVFQDVRGRFASEGKYEAGDPSLSREGADGYDSVECLANQPWCDGNICTAGASANGHLQWILAEENPPHLKAISPWMVGPTQDVGRPIGVTILSVVVSNTAFMALDIADKLEKSGKDVSEMRQMVKLAATNPEEVYNFLPLKDAPHFMFEGIQEMWRARISNAVPDSKATRDVPFPYEKIKVPCFYVSGWYDNFAESTIDSFLKMRNKGSSKLVREGQYIVMGPWSHGQLIGSLGDIDFGSPFGIADARGAQIAQQNIAFYDKYLRGKDIKLPAVNYFVMGRNVWKTADAWPPPQNQWQRFFLHSGGSANNSSDNGILTKDEPGSEPVDIFVYNPQLPVPTTGGRGRAACGFVCGPIEQSHVERRDDVLLYTTPELKEDIEISGPLKLHLFAATSARDTDFTAKFCDVYPDGRSFNVTDGIIRARYRKGVVPKLINPGEVNEYIIDLGNVSQVFRKGHKIRIDISSSNFPTYDRNMNTGNPIGEDAYGITATQTIYHSSIYASYIDLPVIP